MLRVLMFWLCRVLLQVCNKRWRADPGQNRQCSDAGRATFSAQTTLNNGTNTIPFQRVIMQSARQPRVQLMRMRPSGSVSITYPGSGTSLRAGMPTLCDKNNDEKEEIISISVVAPMFALAGNKWNTTLPGGNMHFRASLLRKLAGLKPVINK